MKPKHTPGPWAAHYNRVCPVDGPQDGTNDIAHVYSRKSGHEYAANLRLIAAAPELLRLLELALKDVCVAHRYYPDKGDENPPPFILDIEEALKKARGE